MAPFRARPARWIPSTFATILPPERHRATHGLVKLARHLSALSFLAFLVLVAGGPLGCNYLGMLGVPPPPTIPDMPQLPPPPEIPEVPKPPDPPQSPQMPAVDVPEDHDGGVCCVRTGAVETMCGVGAKRCCTLKLDGAGACESAGHLWFHSVDGCRGAC
ncbi:hypothetical protein [Chondromyces crocatus]|uniref:Uncharacterized protein n=1 Tax=Chondromyces crocatus TaxID=52 RepID=A0A0K1ELU4_CHOCO|nr:hypothetical protein [Chondromyces crocatus]AKT41834.1 uncharacterized protein CMC5_060450 [Chondromyces crocatus]